MIKKHKLTHITIITILAIFISNIIVWAETTDIPSNWAKLEVETAIQNELVPTDLMKEYDRDITRSEYTLLALKLLNKTGQAIEIKEHTPFYDIDGHKYEEQLVRAYNAGIISGYGDGEFNPDKRISREEIATLVVKLLKQINPEKSVAINQSYNFIDKDQISSWAMDYINYCYENNILKGINDLEINPKGEATIEQAIILIYRLAEKEDLLNDNNIDIESIEIVDYRNGERVVSTTNIIKSFADDFNKETTKIIKKLSEDEDIDLIDMKTDRAVLMIKDIAVLDIMKSKYEISFYASTIDLNTELFISSVNEILETLDNENDLKRIFISSIEYLRNDKDQIISENIYTKFYIEANSEVIKDENGNESVKYNFNFHDTIE